MNFISNQSTFKDMSKINADWTSYTQGSQNTLFYFIFIYRYLYIPISHLPISLYFWVWNFKCYWIWRKIIKTNKPTVFLSCRKWESLAIPITLSIPKYLWLRKVPCAHNYQWLSTLEFSSRSHPLIAVSNILY